jgi:hypothetical protein
VLDDKVAALTAELRAIELWDSLLESAVPINEIDRAGGLEARRRRRSEIIGEINILLNKTGRDSERTQHGMPLSAGAGLLSYFSVFTSLSTLLMLCAPVFVSAVRLRSVGRIRALVHAVAGDALRGTSSGHFQCPAFVTWKSLRSLTAMSSAARKMDGRSEGKIISSRLILNGAYVCFHSSDVFLKRM